jgi:hypothetical protein
VPFLISICGDPGGARAIVPVIQLLESEKKIGSINYAYNEGYSVLKSENIKVISLSGGVNRDSIQKILKKYSPSILLTSTSCNQLNWERQFIKVARALSIKSFTVLDFWSNYLARFLDEDKTSIIFPDQIAVMDSLARQELILEGFHKESILVTGQPAFDSLVTCRSQFSLEKRIVLRKDNAVGDDDILIVFASQPIKKLTIGSEIMPYPGYDEVSVLTFVIHSLEHICVQSNKKITLLIKPHPREKNEDYKMFKSNTIEISTSFETNSRDLVMAADLVIGMNSVLLFEACYLGQLVLSFQPNLCGKDTLVTNFFGLSVGVVKPSDLTTTIYKLLFDHTFQNVIKNKLALLGNQKNAARCIVDHLYSSVKFLC